jgi:hypothetical protein
MSRLVAFDVDDGGSILIEVDDPHSGPVTRGGARDEVIEKASASLEQVLGQLTPVLRGAVARLRDAAEAPDEVQLEFAIKISTDANLIIARTGGEANFRIALTWKRGPDH